MSAITTKFNGIKSTLNIYIIGSLPHIGSDPKTDCLIKYVFDAYLMLA